MNKFITGFLIFLVLFTQNIPIYAATAVAVGFGASSPPENAEELYEITALIVDDELMDDSADYSGLQEKFDGLSSDTLEERILRYAADIREENPLMDVKILYFDKEKEGVVEIASALENLYRNGVGGRNNRLAGAVFIGNVPLPVVNKNGNKYVSMFPYTDFLDKAYVYNETKKEFELDDSVSFPKQEIWHGVIRAPQDGLAGRQKLAEFFDKNHLYYSGDPEFSQFSKKLFFADLVAEKEKINPSVYQYYLKYLDAWEDMTYMRYNKFWANEFSQSLYSDIPLDSLTAEGAEFLNNVKSGDSMSAIPDIYTKNIIDQYLYPYYKVISKYIADANDLIQGTGRYSSSDATADILPVLITIKDEFTRLYLKSVNDELEKKINEISEKIAKPLPLLEYSTLSGNFGNGDPFQIKITQDMIDDSTDYRGLSGQEIAGFWAGILPTISSQKFRFNYKDGDKLYINGVDADLIESPRQCSVYLGSTNTDYFDQDLNFNPKAVNGEYSIMTRSIRSDDLKTATTNYTAGVNTKLTAVADQNGQTLVGGIVEDNLNYGVSAFSELDSRENPWKSYLQKGDLITKVNGKSLGCGLDNSINQVVCYSFDNAINDAFEKVKMVMQSVNAHDLEKLKNENLKEAGIEELLITPITGSDSVMREGSVSRAIGNLKVDYYRKDGENYVLNSANLTFTVEFDNHDDDNIYDDEWKVSKRTPAGNFRGEDLKLMVAFTNMPENYIYDKESNGAIFSLYNTYYQGYDSSGGCNMNNTIQTSGRCFPLIAKMPVLDSAGSMSLGKVDNKLKFPERIGQDEDKAKHMETFQFPGGSKDDHYQYEDIDEVHFDSCYNGMPDLDSPAACVDVTEGALCTNVSLNLTLDVYDRVLKNIQDFINDGDLGNRVDEPTDKFDFWLYDKLDAAQIILNSDPVVTLKDFSDYFGIPAKNLSEIGRKLLSKDTEITVPAASNNTGRDITLKVETHPYANNPSISSVVIHNEPTEETITNQVLSGTTLSLPIDNPRYVAFLDSQDKTQKIVYPNLFRIPNEAQLNADLSVLANEIAAIPGSYKIFGHTTSPNEYSLLEIRDEILNNYLRPGITDGKEVYEAINWASFSIDEKHGYLLSNYLREDSSYEAAYIVSEGDFSHFDMAFDKSLDEKETDARFDPLNFEYDEGEGAGEGGVGVDMGAANAFGDAGEGGEGGGNEGYVFVDLRMFMSDVDKFLDGFKDPEFVQKCSDTLITLQDEESQSKNIQLVTYNYIDEELYEEGDTLIADNESLMKAEVYLYNDAGELLTDSSYRVRFAIESDIPNAAEFQGSSEVQSNFGKAGAIIRAGKKTGKFILKVDVVGEEDFGITTKAIYLTAGESAQMEITTDSNVLVSNGQSATNVYVTLKDKFGNIAENSFDQLSISADGPVSIDSAQIFAREGKADFQVRSLNETGTAKVSVSLMDYELNKELLKSSKEFKVFEKVNLNFGFPGNKKTIVADNSSIISFETKLMSDGAVLSGYNGPIRYTILTNNLLEFADKVPSKMISGFVSTDKLKLKSKNKIGTAEILVDVPGFISDVVKIEVTSGPAEKIELTTSEEILSADKNSEIFLQAKILDKNGNVVETDNSTVVNFSATEATKSLVQFVGPKTAIASNGIASTKIKAGVSSGKVHLIAQAQNIKEGTLTLSVKKNLDIDEIKKFAPQALYMSLLGDAFFDPTIENVAETLLFNGELQAITTTTASVNDKKRLIGIDSFGKIDLLSSDIQPDVIPATNSFPYQKIVFSDPIRETEIGYAFLVPKNETPIVLADSETEKDDDGIYVKMADTSHKDITLEKNDERIYIKKGSSILGSVDKFGRIFVDDDSLFLRLIYPDDGIEINNFMLGMEYQKKIIVTVDYKQNFEKDVKILPENLLYPGIYFGLSDDSGKYGTVSSLTGNSTNNPKGVYVVDNENVISQDQAPGFSQTSLEDASDTFGVGFKGENKQMLFFSSGNSVGESNIPYASDVGINLGDPLIRLDVDQNSLTSSGFTKDIGDPIFSDEEEIENLIQFDYNGDGYDDLLIIREEGLIRLLENEISNQRFFDKGNILNVYGGIYSATKIDIDNDGYDDLIVGTKDSCKVNEPCVSLFKNNNETFERTTLNLQLGEGGKILESKSADMNKDGCEDLVISDSASNVRIFYNKKASGVCAGLSSDYDLNENFAGEKASKISFYISESPENPDEYPDIFVKPAYNPEGKIIYLYSTGILNGKVSYRRKVAESESAETPGSTDQSSTIFEQENLEKLQAAQNRDANYNGCIDSWEISGGAAAAASASVGESSESVEDIANRVASGIQKTISALKCSSGGCFPTPYNHAFFAPEGPSPSNPAVVNGTTVFSLVSYFPFILPFQSSWDPSSYFRFYLSPTTTLGLGTAICIGPGAGHQSPCFAFAVPLDEIGLCPNFGGAVNDAIAKAKDANISDTGTTTVVSDGSDYTGSESIIGSSSFDSPDTSFSYSGATNIRIPGFPSVLTEWFDNEMDELYSKLLDFPDIYFIYPDVGTMISDQAISSSNFDKIKSLNDFLQALNSIPLIRIEGKEILVRVPSITNNEIIKWKRQAEAWIKYEEGEIEKIKASWSCDEREDIKTLCDSVILKMNEFIASVRKAMEKLDRVAKLPQEILNWKALESKYASQIICYLDTVMDLMGGYINRQERIIKSWMKAIDNTLEIFKSWKVLLDIMIDYQKSCDKCKSDRNSDLGLLMNFFMVIPDLPTIPLPKWPDIVFDISQVQTGVNIIWPDLVFKPETIKLPNLPTINLSSILVPDWLTLSVNLSGFKIPEWLDSFPDFVLPKIPDLPALPIIQLPDLPRPPKIFALPDAVVSIAKDLRIFFKILCLLKTGLLSVPEWGLATEIETLTQPSVKAVLPFIKDLGVQMPEIEYDSLKQIKVILKSSFKIETDFVYVIVKKGVESLNTAVENVVKKINQYTGFPLQEVINSEIEKAKEKLKEETMRELDEVDTDTEIETKETYYLSATQKFLNEDSPELNREISDIKNADSLIAHVENLKDENSEQVSNEGLTASTNVENLDNGGSRVSTNKFSLFGDESEKEILIAADLDVGLSESDTSTNTGTVPRGLFVNKENVLSYLDEMDSKISLLTNDFDNDSDDDLIFSLGKDIYLKNNQTSKNEIFEEKGDLISFFRKEYVSDYAGEEFEESDFIPTFPQECADKQSPLPVLMTTDFELPIYKTLEIDASSSIDANGEIVGYYLETVPLGTILWSDKDTSKDTDEDGVKNNDKSNPVFKIGPFDKKSDLGAHEYILHVVDQSGNSSAQKFNVNVYVPYITLDETFSRTKIATGETIENTAEIPFSLMRETYVYRVRDGKLFLVPREGQSAEKVGDYKTDASGAYSISDFSTEDMILVENSAGKIIAEINPDSGNIKILDENYKVRIVPANPPLKPTRAEIVDKDGKVLGTVYFVADTNIDVKTYDGSYEIYGGENFSGVNIFDPDTSDQFEIKKLPANDENYPGGAVLFYKNESKQMAIIETTGNIILLDNRMSLRQKENNYKEDPFIIEMLFNGKPVAEVLISSSLIGEKVFIVGPDEVPFSSPRNPSTDEIYQEGFVNKLLSGEEQGSEVNPELETFYQELVQKGILDEQIAGLTEYKLNDRINRAEFVKILLTMLCIVPREEAYLPDSGYFDIAYDENNLAWYYPYVKEASLLGFIQGYQGELNEQWLAPFKPENTISRAEAAKIILEALSYKGFADVSTLQVSNPWYKEFLSAAQNLTPILKSGAVLQNNFIVTPQEALLPDKAVSYEDMLLMAGRVLKMYDCFKADKDDDGMSDYCEEKYKIDDPKGDPDKDGINNVEECYKGTDPNKKEEGAAFGGVGIASGDLDQDGLTDLAETLIYKTDPSDPDTDDGGVFDGAEVSNYTDPLNKTDDFGKGEQKEGISGIYIVPAECNSCPCVSTFSHKADITTGDTFYSRIFDKDGKVLSESNRIKIE